MPTYPFALQLYTVRDHCDRDLPGALRRVKEIGYDFVELAGFWGKTPEECKQALDNAGLKAICTHVPFEMIRDDLDAVKRACAALEIDYACCPILLPEHHPARRHWKRSARVLGDAGRALAKEGITLCYHNHAHEFNTIWGKYIFDIIMDTAGADGLAAELDIYWTRYGGEDPMKALNQYMDRCPLIHVKDMAPGHDRAFAEVGRGIIDWSAILPAARAAGAKWFIVEQDECPGDSLESAAISFEYMNAL